MYKIVLLSSVVVLIEGDGSCEVCTHGGSVPTRFVLFRGRPWTLCALVDFAWVGHTVQLDGALPRLRYLLSQYCTPHLALC